MSAASSGAGATFLPPAVTSRSFLRSVIYRAIENGTIRINGKNICFRLGNEIVFEPWLVRLARPGLTGPLQVGSLNKSTDFFLCCEALPQLEELSQADLPILHRILYH